MTNGFCFIQKERWEKIRGDVESNLSCLKCKGKLKMISKWKAKCTECNTSHTIKKPKGFPKNSFDTRNWKSTCDECGGKMDFYKGGSCGAYICRKCGNALEV